VGYVKAVDGINFTLHEGETLGIVGESGCGKTTLGKALMRLLPVRAGNITFENRNLFKLKRKQSQQLRADMQMIFQDPAMAMDPHMDIEEIIEEGMLALKIGTDKAERIDRINHLLAQVGLNPQIKSRYPHELSGGQKQRVAIARALAVGAKLIVCDEPTSALDVSVQAQIINLLKSLQEDLGISFLFITHNIGIVRYLANNIAVMYNGKIVEYGPAHEILNNPQHEYTQTLLRAVPTQAHT
jgi:ABC-type oligopeptide transport system ATPase subunit